MKEFIELDKIKTRVLEQGIIEIFFKGGSTIEVEDIWELRETNINLACRKHYTVLVQSDNFISFTKETRELLSSSKFSDYIIAKAIVYEGVGQHILANFYLHINKPYIKTKLFTCREKATKWLREEYQFNMSSRSCFNK